MIEKYRAWIKTEGCFADYIESIRFYSKEIDLCWGGICESDCFNFEDVIFMQSTGVVDKNGKEIFEGDIILTNAYGCIVGFGEYTYFEDENSPITEIGYYLSFLNVKPATYAPFDKYYWANCEVIGNIYENELDLIVYEAYKYNKETSEDKE